MNLMAPISTRITRRVLLTWVPILGLFCALPVFGGGTEAKDAVVAAAKRIYAEQQDAVVGISAVAKISLTAEGSKDAPVNIPDREQKMESIGTIIDPAGLVVTALSTLDPSKEVSGREVRYGGGTIRLEASADLKEVRIILADGTEIPGEVIMKDADLDLCFLQLKMSSKEAKGVVLKALDLRRGDYKAFVSDDVISLGRMDEVLNRQATVSRGQILAVTLKPRQFIRISGASMGGPSFTPDGRVVGIAVNRSYRGRNSVQVVIPAFDVLEIADQAKQAHAAASANKKEAAKPDKKAEPDADKK